MMWRFTPARRTCAPIIRMLAALLLLALPMRRATSANCGCANGGAGPSSESQRSKCRSCLRSASGLIASRERSNTAYLLAIGEECMQELAMAEEIWNDEIRAHAGEALPLPLVYGGTLRFRSGNADGNAAHFLYVLDLDVAVAETQKLFAFAFGSGDDLLDENFLGKTFVVVERAEHAAVKIAGDIEQLGLAAHVDLIGAAGQIHFQAARF